MSVLIRVSVLGVTIRGKVTRFAIDILPAESCTSGGKEDAHGRRRYDIGQRAKSLREAKKYL